MSCSHHLWPCGAGTLWEKISGTFGLKRGGTSTTGVKAGKTPSLDPNTVCLACVM